MAENERRQDKGVEEHSERGSSPALAIGFPIGAVLAVMGAMIALHGLFGTPDNDRSLGVNMDLWWGMFMVLFGCVVLGMSWISPRRRAGYRRDR